MACVSFLAVNIDKASDINSSDGIMPNDRGVQADGTQNGQSSSCCDRSGTSGAFWAGKLKEAVGRASSETMAVVEQTERTVPTLTE